VPIVPMAARTRTPRSGVPPRGFRSDPGFLVPRIECRAVGPHPGTICSGPRAQPAQTLRDISPARDHLVEYLQTLYLRTWPCCGLPRRFRIGLGIFCARISFALRAAAGAITKGSRAGANAQELADSLFAELYGLVDGKRGERSLFRYFHGRSSLKTWLRAVLAQRHVDRLRESRRWNPSIRATARSPSRFQNAM